MSFWILRSAGVLESRKVADFTLFPNFLGIASLSLALLSVCYVFFAYENIGLSQRFGLTGVLIGGPLLLILRQEFQRSKQPFPLAVPNISLGLGFGLLLACLPLLGQSRWFDLRYLVNLPDYLYSNGESVHVDSAFHISLIRGIMQFGYPNTGLDSNPFVSYHALSHYFDAALYLIFNIDPWQGFALLGYLKSVSLILFLVHLGTRICQNNKRFSSIVLILVTLGLTFDWGVTGSQPQWLATVIVILITPHVVAIFDEDRFPIRAILIVSIAISILLPTKVMTALALAIVSGALLFVEHYRNPRTYLVGILWLTIHGGYFLLTSGYGNSTDHATMVFGVFNGAWHLILSVLLLGVGLASHANLLGQQSQRKFGLALVLSSVTFLLIFFFALSRFGEPIQFSFNLLLVQLLVAYAFILRVPASLKRQESQRIQRTQSFGLGQILLVTILPLILHSSSIYWPPEKVTDSLTRSNTLTFQTINEFLVPERKIKVFRETTSARLESISIKESLISELRTGVKRQLKANNFLDSQALLLIPRESWNTLEERLGIAGYSSPLQVRAAVGVTLLASVEERPPYAPDSYGYRAYSGASERMSVEALGTLDPCDFDKPIVIATLNSSWSYGFVSCPASNRKR